MAGQERDTVLAARGGDLAAFERLVIAYRGRAWGLARRALGDPGAADETVQEAFLKAFTRIGSLRDPGSFGPWLFRICRNAIADRARRAGGRDVSLESVEGVLGDPRADAEWDGYADLLRVCIGMLRPRLREAIRLRCFANLSLGEIGSLCGVSAARVKSRLHEAREKLRQTLPLLHQGLEASPGTDARARRETMESVQKVRDGAHVIERLSLARQVRLCASVKAREKFDAETLAAIGEVDTGVAFVEQCHATLSLAELVDILNYADPGVENRIVDELERRDPEFAETLKQNMFVFEDFVLFDAKAIRTMVSRVKERDLLLGLASTLPNVREHILSALPGDERPGWLERIRMTPVRGPDTNAARFAVVEACRKLNHDTIIRGHRDADGRWSFTASE